MKKSLKVILAIALISMFCIPSVSMAMIADTETVELYKQWEELSKKEKENYYQPVPFTVNYDYDLSSDLYKGSELELVSGLKASYQARYQIENLEVRNQEDTMQCWAFSTTSILESNIEKLTDTVSNLFSPRHMDYATSYTFSDGTNPRGYKREVGTGGNVFLGMSYYTSGLGPVLEEDMPFENSEHRIPLAEIQNKDVVKKVDDYKVYPSIYKEHTNNGIVYYNGYEAGSPYRIEYTENQIQEVRNQIKAHILQYGAISSNTYAGEHSLQFFNIEKAQNEGKEFAYFCDSSDFLPDHAITIVGWDDTYAKENFNSEHIPSTDGAYIVLNSYGEDLFNGGYYYVSYEDIFVETTMVGIVKTSDVDYDTLYQHDELGYSFTYVPTTTSGETFSMICAANVFTKESTEVEELTEVSYYVNETANVKLYVNAESGNLAEAVGVVDLGLATPGYHTHELTTPIKLTGDKFVVAFVYETDSYAGIPLELNYSSNNIGNNFWDTAEASRGESFISSNGRDWYDLMDLGINDANICIKAFTTKMDEEEVVPVSTVSLNLVESDMNIGDSLSLKATVLPENATNKTVTWTSSDETVATVNDGIVKALAAGETTITVTTVDGAKTASCTITVLAQEEEIFVTRISIDTISLTTYVGRTDKITATVFPENATDKTLVWASNDTSIARVDNNGNVKGIGAGKTTITVTNQRSGISESVLVTVIDPGNGDDNDGSTNNTVNNTANNTTNNTVNNTTNNTTNNTNRNNTTNNTTNNTNRNNTTNNTNKNNTIATPGNTTQQNSSKDDTISPEKLPATGSDIIQGIITIVALGILGLVIKKNYDLRDVK